MISSIRHISAVNNCEFFLAAEYERNVHVYKKGHKEIKLTITSHLDAGGERLQLIPENQSLIAGAYNVYGIECYSMTTGNLLWKRKDLKKIQDIRKHPESAMISCFFDDRAGLMIDCSTGEVVSKYRGVKNVFFSPHNSLLLEESSIYKVKDRDQLLFEVKPESFAILDAIFAPTVLAISEAGGNLRFLSSKDGELVGKYTPKNNSHVLSLSYCPMSNLFIGLLYHYQSPAAYYLIHFSQDGKEHKRLPICEGYAHALFSDRQSFLNASGLEICWDTGKKIFHYDFPDASKRSKS